MLKNLQSKYFVILWIYAPLGVNYANKVIIICHTAAKIYKLLLFTLKIAYPTKIYADICVNYSKLVYGIGSWSHSILDPIL
jgi:hypothetical protein